MENLNKEVKDSMEVTNKLLLEMVKNQKQSTKNLVKVFITTIICFALLLIVMVVGFFVYESQFEVIDGEYEYSIEQSVDGENSNINNVNGNQYNDNATHNEN